MQRDRILRTKEETEQPLQLSLFPEEELRQLEADCRQWDKRLNMLVHDGGNKATITNQRKAHVISFLTFDF